MSLLPYRTLQTTSTTGTGTLTLNAVASGRRSYQDAYGSSSIVVRYVISGATYFEVGIGTYDGGSPGTLTRTTVIASSNSGSLVSLPAGTADVFPWLDPAERGVYTGTGALSLTLAELGNAVVWSGSSAQSAGLPAIATVPAGAGYQFRNAGTATLTIDPNSTETVNGATTLALAPGACVDCIKVGGGWQAFFGPDANAMGAAIWGGTAGGTANALTLSLSPAPTVYVAGQTIKFLVGSTNTGAATLNVNGLGAKNIKHFLGVADLVVGDLPAGAIAEATYDGTSFRLKPIQSSRFIGEEIAFFGSTLPTGVLWCAGQAVSRTTYAALFAVLSTTYGTGDGSTTFNLPDLRGRFGAGRDDMNGSAANRITNAVAGITATNLGAAGGDQNVGAHTHTASSTAVRPTLTYEVSSGGSTTAISSGGITTTANVTATTNVPVQSVTPTITVDSGGTGAAANIPPALVRNVGIYAGV